MNRMLNMVKHAPAMAEINQGAYRISEYKHVLSYGLWVFGALALTLVLMRAPIQTTACISTFALALGYVYWRWAHASHRIGDPWIQDRILTDSVDLAWLAWVRDFEPEIDELLLKRRPDGQYTLKDFRAAYMIFAFYRVDLPQRYPWRGDTDACFAAQELRRDRQRQARN